MLTGNENYDQNVDILINRFKNDRLEYENEKNMMDFIRFFSNLFDIPML